ncbi:MAG: hypothetical protein PHY12_06400 [Eubacteriales bacterium]|nr:hypothetical protein [Eubacteriales bacterium]
MKRMKWIVWMGLALSIALCAPALAQTTGIAVDGKTYAFRGSEGIYEADGKTFVIGADTVTIKEPGKADRVLTLSQSADTGNAVAGDAFVSFESAAETGEFAQAYGESAVAEDAPDAAVCVEGTAADSVDGVTVIEHVLSSCAMEDAAVDAARFDEYARFGLSYDATGNALYYQGQRVRIFEDTYALDEQSCVALEHMDDQGTIDVRAKRDMTKKSFRADGSEDLTATLTGLYALSDAEFAARDLADWTQTQTGSTAATATTEGEMTIAEKIAFYAPYEAFGLRYDAGTDALTYHGQRVRTFTDIRQSNGEALGGGRFHGVMTQTGFEGGEIDIETIRDYAKPDANGDGTLLGITVEKAR